MEGAFLKYINICTYMYDEPELPKEGGCFQIYDEMRGRDQHT